MGLGDPSVPSFPDQLLATEENGGSSLSWPGGLR